MELVGGEEEVEVGAGIEGRGVERSVRDAVVLGGDAGAAVCGAVIRAEPALPPAL